MKLLCRQSPCRLASASNKCPRQELNLVLDLRRVVCESGTPQGPFCFSASPRNRTPSCSFEHCRAHPAHPQGALLSQYPDLDSNQGPDLRRVRCKSATPSGFNLSRADDWIRTSINRFTRAEPFSVERAPFGTDADWSGNRARVRGVRAPTDRLVAVRQFWRLAALPGAHSCSCKSSRHWNRERALSITSPARRSSTPR